MQLSFFFILLCFLATEAFNDVPSRSLLRESELSECSCASFYVSSSGEEAVEPTLLLGKRALDHGVKALQRAGFDDPAPMGREELEKKKKKKKKKKHRLGPPIVERNQVPLPVPDRYSNAAWERGPAYYDWKRFKITYAKRSNYMTYGYLSHGGFSQVYRGRAVKTNQACVVKVLVEVTQEMLQREVLLLTRMADVDNVIPLLDVIKDESGYPALIFPLVNNVYYKDVYPSMTVDRARSYLYRVAKVLDTAHERGIIHGDMKPLNVLYDAAKDELFVSDWGLSMFYLPNNRRSARSGTRYWKAPELHLGCEEYGYAVDVWAFGIMFAGMINNTFHMFSGGDTHALLGNMVAHYGRDEFDHFVNKYQIKVSSSWTKKYIEEANVQRKEKPWNWNATRAEFTTEPALDLAKRLLQFDPANRITMHDVLKHPYFKDEKKSYKI